MWNQATRSSGCVRVAGVSVVLSVTGLVAGVGVGVGVGVGAGVGAGAGVCGASLPPGTMEANFSASVQ